MAGKINHAAAARPILTVAVADVAVPEDRLRALKKPEAIAIGEAIKADGQYEPIAVCKLPGRAGFLLVDGLHRLEGSRMAGLVEIEARLVPPDKTARRRQEVLSAWARVDHDAFDYAAQVAAMVDLAQSRDAAITVADEKTASATVALAVGWDAEAYQALSISRRSMFNYLRIHRFFSAEQKRALREAGLADELMPLHRLAALPPEDFDFAWAKFAEGQVHTIAEMLALVSPNAETDFAKQTRSLVKKLDSWDQGQRREFIRGLLQRYDSDGALRPGMAGTE